MTGRQRGPGRDPLDEAAPPLISRTESTSGERARARDAVVRRATSLTDLHDLLGALGLDHPAEINAQLQQPNQLRRDRK